MKQKIIVFLVVFLILLISYEQKEVKPKEEYSILNTQEESIKQNINTIKLNYNNQVIELDLEDYVVGVLACEIPASFHKESLKAMSVAARTYALNKIVNNTDYILNSTIRDQCYIDKAEMKNKWKDNFDKYYNILSNAVNETKNEVMTYNNEIIIAFYFSISNGHTENVENVFSQKLDYLTSTDSSWDKEYNYKEETKVFEYEEFNKILNTNNIKETDIVINRTNTNRVNTIKIKDKVYKGTEFRKLFNLRSTDFELYFKDKIEIKTKGYGHGVGMSQYGSNKMAETGYNYKEILSHYYKDIKIVNNY